MFFAYLADAHRTIKTCMYSSGVRFLQISEGQSDPFQGAIMPHLECVLRVVKWIQAEIWVEGARACPPITPPLLRLLKEVWSSQGTVQNTKLIWAACCLCFFAFMHARELTVRDDRSYMYMYDPTIHLVVDDVAIDNPKRPSFLHVRITVKQSKTATF